jgi:hypothetical protein
VPGDPFPGSRERASLLRLHRNHAVRLTPLQSSPCTQEKPAERDKVSSEWLRKVTGDESRAGWLWGSLDLDEDAAGCNRPRTCGSPHKRLPEAAQFPVW